jgi:hypothetical protein
MKNKREKHFVYEHTENIRNKNGKMSMKFRGSEKYGNTAKETEFSYILEQW